MREFETIPRISPACKIGRCDVHLMATFATPPTLGFNTKEGVLITRVGWRQRIITYL